MPSSYNPLHPHPTSEWSSLQQVFYRKSTIYQLSWSIDSDSLSNSDLKAAENGGLLAILRNRSNLQKVALNTRLSTKRERDRDSLAIYTQPGRLVESIPLDSSNKVISFGFTSSEKLVVILEEGIVRTYTLLTPCPTTIDANSTSTSDPNSTSNPPSTSTSDLNNPPIPIEATPNSYYISYSLGPEANEIGLKEARIWKDGLVALTNNNRFIQWKFPLDDLESNGINRNHDDDYGNNVSSPELLPSFELEIDSNSEIVWNFLNPKVSNSGLVEILISPSTIPSTVSISNPIANGNPSSSSVSTSSSTQNEEEGQGTLYSLDILSGIKNNHLKKGPFSSIKPSPNGKLLSLLTFNRKLWVVSSDFQRSLSEFDIEDCSSFQEAEVVTTTINGAASTSRNDNGSQKWNKGGIGGTGIKQIEWCGDFTVALAWEKEVVMVGPFGDSIRYQHPSSIHLISESDGLRIISSTTSDFITKVPSSSTSIFLPGSTHPGSILLESYENFLLKNPKADDGIRTLRSSSGNGNGGSGSKDGDLIQAVETLTMASAFEFDIHWQKKLLKAANFGKGFLENFHPKDFVEMSRKLRVINQLRSAEIGIPISYEQYISVPVTSIISRLTQRNHHLLSIKLSEFLNLKPDSILKHWAKSKISRMKSMTPNSVVIGSSESNEIEDQVSESIIKKFAQQPSANYSSVAKVAFKAGRIRLATKLLDHEPRAVDQVPLLLNMHEDKLALIKALESGDTDLIYHVILRLKSQLSRGDFFRIIQSPQLDQSLTSTTPSISSTSNNINSTTSYLSLASNLLQVYALEQDRELLKDFYYQDDRRTENALLVLEDARNEEDVMEKTFLLKEAMKLFSEDRERGLEAKLTDEQIRLIGFQTALDKEENTASLTKSSFLGLSLNETLKALLAQPHLSSKVEKLRSDFKVPEKRFWNLKLKVLIESKDFDGLWTWASGKKSPIGYEPFVSKLIREGYGKEALRYVSLAAKDKNDRAKLSALCQRIPQQQIANEIVQILEDL